jgi:hypothetical protein
VENFIITNGRIGYPIFFVSGFFLGPVKRKKERIGKKKKTLV